MIVYDEEEPDTHPKIQMPKIPLDSGYYRGKSTYEFPPDRETYYNIEGFEHFRRVIEDDKLAHGRKEINFVVRQYKRENWENLTAYCINCRNETTSINGVKKIVLVNSLKTGRKFVLKYFDNKHNHTATD